jgi:hypothetical protein
VIVNYGSWKCLRLYSTIGNNNSRSSRVRVNNPEYVRRQRVFDGYVKKRVHGDILEDQETWSNDGYEVVKVMAWVIAVKEPTSSKGRALQGYINKSYTWTIPLTIEELWRKGGRVIVIKVRGYCLCVRAYSKSTTIG